MPCWPDPGSAVGPAAGGSCLLAGIFRVGLVGGSLPRGGEISNARRARPARGLRWVVRWLPGLLCFAELPRLARPRAGRDSPSRRDGPTRVTVLHAKCGSREGLPVLSRRRWKPKRRQDAEARFPSSERKAGCRERASGEMARATPTHGRGCLGCPAGIVRHGVTDLRGGDRPTRSDGPTCRPKGLGSSPPMTLQHPPPTGTQRSH